MSEPAPGRTEDRGTRIGGPSFVRLAGGLFLLLSLAAVAIALRGEWAAWTTLEGDLRSRAWGVSVPFLALAGVCGIAALLVSGGLWAGLFRAAGGETGIREAVAAWLGSNLGRYLPGKVWQLASLAAYVRARGGSGATALTVSLALQAVVLTTGAAVAAISLGGQALGAAGPVTFGIAIVLLALLLNPAVLRRSVVWAGRLLREEVDPKASGLDYRALLRTGACAVPLWLLWGIGFWALGRGLVVESPVSVWVATGVYAAGYFVGYVVLLAPGGIVVREGAIAGLLGAVAGVPLGPATAIALAARVWTTVAEVMAFAIAAASGLRRRPEPR